MIEYKKIFSNISILIFALCLLCSMQACHNKIKNEKYNNLFDEQKEKELTQLSNLSKKLDGTFLDSTVILENFISGQKNSIRQLVKERDKLIFQYSELNCDICVDSALVHFKDFALMHDKRQFIIIAASGNRRYMANFVRENKLRNLNVYLVSITGFKRLYVYDTGMPFIYVTNHSLQIKNAFIPAKEYPGISQAYYSRLVDNVFVN